MANSHITKLIREIISEDIGGDDIHILNNTNAVVGTKDVDGFPYRCLQLNLQQDLSEGDIDKLIEELRAFKDQLTKLNTPPKNR